VEAAFIHHILEEPEDHVARRAFADWLMEQPEDDARERGEFIALQCELAGKVRPAARRPELQRRASFLLARYSDAWTLPFRHLVHGFTFRRGLVEAVTLDCAAFVLGADELFAHAPIHEVRLLDLSAATVADVADSPALARLTALDLSPRTGRVDAAVLRVLVVSPHLTRLRRLDLAGCPLGEPGFNALAESPYLQQLTHLGLTGTGATTVGVRRLLLALLSGPGGGERLVHLGLRGNAGFRFAEAEGLLRELEAVLEPALARRARRLVGSVENRVPRRALDELAGTLGGAGVPLLCRALGHPRAAIRAAAAARLNGLGAAALPAVPLLLRRCLASSARDALPFGNVLRALEAQLSRSSRAWLNRLLRVSPAQTALDGALADTALVLPAPVQAAFAALCERRLLWRQRHHPEALLPAVPATAAGDRTALRQVVALVAQQAEAAALRHTEPGALPGPEPGPRARARECAWLAGWLFELLQRHEAGELYLEDSQP
jgi:uncharacterized protein (TIGR02996 family)